MSKTQSKTYEMYHSANNFRWILKEKLISLDNVTRSMIREMQVLGVRNADIAEYLPQFFEEIKNEVVQEQNKQYGRGKRNAG